MIWVDYGSLTRTSSSYRGHSSERLPSPGATHMLLICRKTGREGWDTVTSTRRFWNVIVTPRLPLSVSLVRDVRISSSLSTISRAPEWTELAGVVGKHGASGDEREMLVMWIIADITFKSPDVPSREITAGTTYKKIRPTTVAQNIWGREFMRLQRAMWKQATEDESKLGLHLPHVTVFSMPDLSQRTGRWAVFRVLRTIIWLQFITQADGGARGMWRAKSESWPLKCVCIYRKCWKPE